MSLKHLLHWITLGRSGAKHFELFPSASQVGYEKPIIPKKARRKRKHKQQISKMSRRRNRT